MPISCNLFNISCSVKATVSSSTSPNFPLSILKAIYPSCTACLKVFCRLLISNGIGVGDDILKPCVGQPFGHGRIFFMLFIVVVANEWE